MAVAPRAKQPARQRPLLVVVLLLLPPNRQQDLSSWRLRSPCQPTPEQEAAAEAAAAEAVREADPAAEAEKALMHCEQTRHRETPYPSLVPQQHGHSLNSSELSDQAHGRTLRTCTRPQEPCHFAPCQQDLLRRGVALLAAEHPGRADPGGFPPLVLLRVFPPSLWAKPQEVVPRPAWAEPLEVFPPQVWAEPSEVVPPRAWAQPSEVVPPEVWARPSEVVPPEASARGLG